MEQTSHSDNGAVTKGQCDRVKDAALRCLDESRIWHRIIAKETDWSEEQYDPNEFTERMEIIRKAHADFLAVWTVPVEAHFQLSSSTINTTRGHCLSAIELAADNARQTANALDFLQGGTAFDQQIARKLARRGVDDEPTPQPTVTDIKAEWVAAVKALPAAVSGGNQRSDAKNTGDVPKRMKQQMAETIATELRQTNISHKKWTAEEWADHIKNAAKDKTGDLYSCSVATVNKTSAYKETLKEKGRSRTRCAPAKAIDPQTLSRNSGTSRDILEVLIADEEKVARDAIMVSDLSDKAKAETLQKLEDGTMSADGVMTMIEVMKKPAKKKAIRK